MMCPRFPGDRKCGSLECCAWTSQVHVLSYGQQRACVGSVYTCQSEDMDSIFSYATHYLHLKRLTSQPVMTKCSPQGTQKEIRSRPAASSPHQDAPNSQHVPFTISFRNINSLSVQNLQSLIHDLTG